jgi:hypothetical protein
LEFNSGKIGKITSEMLAAIEMLERLGKFPEQESLP